MISKPITFGLLQNTTDIEVGEELVLMGVPKEDIILGLHPPYKRPYTGYGVAGEEVKLTENRL